MSLIRLIIASLGHHWRVNSAVALGVMTATAVLTGALVVGDSLRGSLRGQVLDRLGSIDQVLVVPRFVRAALAMEIAGQPAFAQNFGSAVPIVLLQASVDKPGSMPRARAVRVNVIGSGNDFWHLGSGGPPQAPGRDEIVINQPLAERLNAKVGDELLVRIGHESPIPADNPLGRRQETIRTTSRLKVTAIIPAHGFGAFALHPSQQDPLNAYVATETLQRVLDQTDMINVILVSGKGGETDAGSELNSLLKPTLADYGLLITRTKRGYFSLTSDRMLLPPVVERTAIEAFGKLGAQPVLTYLANYITAGTDAKAKIPYSTIAALDLVQQPPLGPLLTPSGEPIAAVGPNEIVLNSWAADDLAAQGVKIQPGDEITITYFAPESIHGEVIENTAKLTLKAIARLEGPAADPDLTPELKGVTDEESIADWQPPFPYDAQRVRSTPPNDQDERYWDQHKATPKGFVSLTTGRKLWSSRFGNTTSVRIPAADGVTAAQLTEKLMPLLLPREMGFEFMPIKAQALDAAEGTTSFSTLFLGFSFFIIAAAVMLVALLFRLGIEQRAREVGLMLAVGLRPRMVGCILLGEGLLVAAIGGLAGVAAGVGYAWLMIAALTHPDWWLQAIGTPFLRLHVAPGSLLMGYLIGVAISAIAIALSLRALRRKSSRQLLSGQIERVVSIERENVGRAPVIAVVLLLLAVGLGSLAFMLGGEAKAGAFFGSGALVLAALLTLVWSWLRADRWKSLIVVGGLAPLRLAVCNAGRHAGRSTLSIGLMAAACFLIIAVSAFRLDPASIGNSRHGGSGGFNLWAQSDQPIYFDLGTPQGREELGFTADESALLNSAAIMPFRVLAGDDASCLNLYRPRQPRVLGVTRQFINRGGFSWSNSVEQIHGKVDNPWVVLKVTLQGPAVPVVLDENTALYSLHLGSFASSPLGKVIAIQDRASSDVDLEVWGLLKNSIFQGDLLISEENFQRLFPEVSGYRLFLIDTPDPKAVAQVLEGTLGDYGFQVETTSSRLESLFAIQNTYLSTFQSLGGLGLLLGTLGLAAAQLRSVFERRGELALLRAVGFRRGQLALLVLLENAALLIAGLTVGAIAAAVALLPHLIAGAAMIPLGWLAVTLAAVLVVGLVAGLAAVHATLKAELLQALRES